MVQKYNSRKREVIFAIICGIFLTFLILIDNRETKIDNEFISMNIKEDNILQASKNQAYEMLSYENLDNTTSIMLVKSGTEITEFYGAESITEFNGFYYLTYKSVEECSEAFNKFVRDDYIVEYNDVIINADITTNEEATTNPEEIDWIEPEPTGDIEGYIDIDLNSFEIDVNAHVNSTGQSWDLDYIDEDSVIVGVIDSGLDISNPIFKNRVVNFDSSVGAFFVVNNTIDSKTYEDATGHGTTISEIIVSETPDNVYIYPYKVFDENGYTTVGQVYEALMSCDYREIDVINLSMSYDGYSEMLEYAINYLYSQGTKVIVSAGNDGGNACNNMPGNIDSAITIGAVKSDKIIETYSNTGECLDFVALGNYGKSDGTSIATAYVSSYAAIIDSFEKKYDKEIYLEHIFLSVAEDLGEEGYDSTYGNGYLSKEKIISEIEFYLSTGDYSKKNIDYNLTDKLVEVSSDISVTAEDLDKQLKEAALNRTYYFNINWNGGAGTYYITQCADAYLEGQYWENMYNYNVGVWVACGHCNGTPFYNSSPHGFNNGSGTTSITISGNFSSHTPFTVVTVTTAPTGYHIAGMLESGVYDMVNIIQSETTMITCTGYYVGDWLNQSSSERSARADGSTTDLDIVWAKNYYSKDIYIRNQNADGTWGDYWKWQTIGGYYGDSYNTWGYADANGNSDNGIYHPVHAQGTYSDNSAIYLDAYRKTYSYDINIEHQNADGSWASATYWTTVSGLHGATWNIWGYGNANGPDNAVYNAINSTGTYGSGGATTVKAYRRTYTQTNNFYWQNPNTGDWTWFASRSAVQRYGTTYYSTTSGMSANPPTGYHFWRYNKDSWEVKGDKNDVDGNGHYIANTYTVAYNGNGATGGSTASSSHTYDVTKALTANGYYRKFTVTFNANGGTCTTTSGTANATFAGWAKSTSGASAYGNGASVVNLTATNRGTYNLYAKWNNAVLSSLPTPSRTGYTFKGWYTAASGGTKITTSTNFTGATTVYAQWTPNTYYVSYAKGSTNNGGTTSKSTHTYDANVTLRANGFTGRSYSLAFNENKPKDDKGVTTAGTVTNLQTTKSGTLSFKNWYITDAHNNNKTNASANTNIGKKNYRNDHKGTASATAQWNSVTLKDYSSPSLKGYKFNGYFTAASGGTKTTTITVDPATTAYSETLYAQWTPITYKVRFNGNNNWNTSQGSYTQTITYDTHTKLTSNKFTRPDNTVYGGITYKKGYTFLGWGTSPNQTTPTYTDGQIVNNLTATDGQIIDLYAIWKKTVTLTINFNGGKFNNNGTSKVLSYTMYNSELNHTFDIKDYYGTPTGTDYYDKGLNNNLTKTVSGVQQRFLGYSLNQVATIPDTQFDTFAYTTRTEAYNIRDNTTLYAIWEPVLQMTASLTTSEGHSVPIQLTNVLTIDNKLGSFTIPSGTTNTALPNSVTAYTENEFTKINATNSSTVSYTVSAKGASNIKFGMAVDSRILDIYTNGKDNSWYDELNRLTDFDYKITDFTTVTDDFVIPKYLGTTNSYKTSNPNNAENTRVYGIKFTCTQPSYYYEKYWNTTESISIYGIIFLEPTEISAGEGGGNLPEYGDFDFQTILN